jgi:prevent-host-death family protein
MLTLAIAEARAQFSQVLKQVQAGEEVAIASGKRREPIAVIIPFPVWEEKKEKKRKLGTLEHWNVTISEDWKMTTEEFLNPNDPELFGELWTA